MNSSARPGHHLRDERARDEQRRNIRTALRQLCPLPEGTAFEELLLRIDWATKRR
jgi:hypothetical protein